MTDKYAVLGQPISQSRSPSIHALFAAQTGARLSYEAIEVAPADVAATLTRLHAEGYRGLNVTAPHKLAAMKLCEGVSERAKLAGAVNTLIRTDRGWRGDTTDGEGLIADLRRLGFPVSGKRALLLGAGGAARSVLKPLLEEKPAELTLSNRNPWKPEELAETFKAVGRIRPCTHLALKGDRFDLVLNATSAGYSGHWLRLPDGLLAPGAAAYDLCYGRAHEPFAAWARSQGCERIADGLGMLVEQAAGSFQLWRGVRPETAAVIAALHAA